MEYQESEGAPLWLRLVLWVTVPFFFLFLILIAACLNLYWSITWNMSEAVKGNKKLCDCPELLEEEHFNLN